MNRIKWHLHHIIPKHMGGTNNPDNLIRVNVAMHAFLHRCLYEEYGLVEDRLAWQGLSGQKPFREIDIEKEKIRRQKISEKTKGKIVSEKTRKLISYNAKQRYKTEAGRKHILKISKNGLGKKKNEETKKKISNALLGRIFGEESRKMMSEKAKNRSKETCQICLKSMDISNFVRHGHGATCKRKKEK